MEPKRVPPFTAGAHPRARTARWVAPLLESSLDSLERALGIRLARSPSGNLMAPLGSGKFGTVFLTEDGRVVKLTTDDAEPVVATVIHEMQHDPRPWIHDPAHAAVVRIDRIIRLPSKVKQYGSMVPVWAILREDVTPVGKNMLLPGPAITALNAHFDGWVRWFNAKDRPDRMRASVAHVMKGWKSLESTQELADFAAVQRRLWNMGIPLMDTHSGNFGWRRTDRGLQPVVFDLGGSYPLTYRTGIPPIDGQTFERYFPWYETLAEIDTP